MRAVRWMALMVVVAVVAAVPAVEAQTNAEVNAGIQFNFSTPGARSLGLGGAFLGLADDATAAYTNPAGLTTLSKPEVSFEGRMWDYTSTYTDSGHGYGDPTGSGLDTVAGLQNGEASESTTGLSFLSFVLPGDSWALAVYRHELANFEADYMTQGAFTGPIDGVSRFYPVQATMDLEIVNLGASLALQLGEQFSLGFGLSYYSFDMTSLTNRYGFDFTLVDPNAQGGFWGPPSYDPSNVINYQEQVGDDSNVAANFGFKWDVASKVSIGGVFRQGPEFEFTARNILGPASGADGEVFSALECDGLHHLDAENPDKPVCGTFQVPDVYGLGLAIRPTDALTIAFDWTRVEYSALTAKVGNLFPASLDDATAQLSVDDADELHLGLEYVLINAAVPIAFRVGSWYDPAHKAYYDGDPGDDANAQTLAALFREGDDEIHYAAGLGFIFGERFQLDAAADYSSPLTTYSLSGVFRF